jgi:hypothetical protein
MSNKNGSDPASTSGGGEEFKDQNIKYVLSKFEYDLYHEEEDVANKVIRVKRFTLPNKGEKWKVFVDNKVTFTVDGSKIAKKEREFLQTVNGINFILSLAKTGINSMNHFKSELKKHMQQQQNDGKNNL